MSYSSSTANNLFRLPDSDSANNNFTFGVRASTQLNTNYLDMGATAFDLVDGDVSSSIIVCGINLIRVDHPTPPGWFYPVVYEVRSR